METLDPRLWTLALALGCVAPDASTSSPQPLAVASTTPVDEGELRPPRALDGDGAFYVATSDPAKPAVRYVDGQRSLNETCAIQLGNKLNRRVPPAYVNGRPIGFC